MNDAVALRPGARVGRYVLVRPLGRGSARWLAFDPSLQRGVQVELEPPGAARAEHLAAARALARVRHPGVIAVHDVGEVEVAAERHAFVAREWIGTRALEDALVDLSARQLQRWCFELADALAVVHAHGVWHGGLDRGGILVGDDGRVRLDGFGHHRDGLGPRAPEALRDVAQLRERLAALVGRVPSRSGSRTLTRRFAARLRGEVDEDAAALAQRLRRERSSRGLRAVGLVSLLALVVGAAALGRRLSGGEPGCRDDGSEIDGVWSPAVAQSLAQGFVQTQQPTAAVAAESVRRVLDGYAGRWNLQRQSLCQARVDDRLPAAALDAQMACLERRRGELDALVRVLLQPDAELIPRAPTSALSLVAVEHCEGAAALGGARLALPLDERQRSLRQALERARALQLAGRYRPAIETAAAARQAATAAVDGALRAELSIELGVARGKAGQAAAGLDDLADAVAEAWRIDDANLAADAWIESAFALAEHLRHDERALASIDLAEATLAGAPSDPSLQARLLNVRGVVLLRLGRHAEAASALEQAVTLTEQTMGGLAAASARNSLANTYSLQQRFDEALLQYQAALASYDALVGRDHPDAASVLNNLCALYYRTGAFDEALSSCRAAHDARTRALGELHPVTLGTADNIGAILAAAGRLDEAVQLQAQVLRQREAVLPPDDPQLADSYVNYGNTLLQLGRAEAGMAAFERALAIDRAGRGEDHPDSAITMQNVGRALQLLDRPAEALVYHRRVLALRRSWSDVPPSTLAKSWLHVADAAHAAGERAEAEQAVAAGLAAIADDRGDANWAPLRWVGAQLRWDAGARVQALADARAALPHAIADDVASITAWIDARSGCVAAPRCP